MDIRQNIVENIVSRLFLRNSGPLFQEFVIMVLIVTIFSISLFLIQGYLTVIFLQNSPLHSIWYINLQKSSNTTKEEIGL